MAKSKKSNLWTELEVEFLKNNYKDMTDEELGIHLNRTKSAVERKRNTLNLFKNVNYSIIKITDEIKEEIIKLNVSVSEAYKILAPKYNITINQIESFYKKTGISKNKNRRWTDSEIEFLKNNSSSMSTEELSIHLSRTPTAISKKRILLGIEASNIIYNKAEKDWTTSEILFLKDNIEILSYEEIAKTLNRTVKAVMVKATKSNLIKRGSCWTNGENEILKNNIEEDIYTLVFILERSEKSITHQAKKLGLKIKRRKTNTKIENLINEIIESFNVSYQRYSKPLKEYNYEADFIIGNNIIEVQGDYYHGNPKFYNRLDRLQTVNVKKDKIRKDIFEKANFKVHYIWEFDICNNIDKVKEKIACIISDNNM